MLELLRAIRGDIAEIRIEQREQRGRLASIERHLAYVERDNAEVRAESGGWFDRVLERLEQLDCRPNLRDV